MIVRDRPHGLKLFLTLRGSVLRRILPTLILNTLLATLVTLSHGDLYKLKITMTATPFTMIGLPLAIFLGFRNSAAYELVLRSRNLARQCQSLISGAAPAHASLGLDDARVRITYRAIAYAYALRDLLRGTEQAGDYRPFLRADEFHALNGVSNKPDRLMLTMGHDLRDCLAQRHIDPALAVAIDGTLSAMVGAGAACERIKGTPIPFSYTLLLHRTAYMYCFLLPFGLVDSVGFMTPLVVAIVAYTFFGLDALGDELEEPFGLSPNDLALDAMCRGIEINLREALGDSAIPAPLQPVNFQLT
jgi:putative membrane protein